MEEGEQDEAGGRGGGRRARHLPRADRPMIRGQPVMEEHIWFPC